MLMVLEGLYTGLVERLLGGGIETSYTEMPRSTITTTSIGYTKKVGTRSTPILMQEAPKWTSMINLMESTIKTALTRNISKLKIMFTKAKISKTW